MIVAIHQAEHIPWLGFFDKMRQADIFVILDNVQFTKNNFQNRNRIIDQNQALHWLSVPVITKNHLNKKFNDIEVSYNHNWQKRYLGKLHHCYSKQTNYKLYINLLQEIILDDYKCIFDLNMAIINLFRNIFKIETPIILASTLQINGSSSELLLNICKKLEAKIYLSGLGGMDYLKEEVFVQESILIKYHDFKHPLYTKNDCRYYLSSLDTIFTQFNEPYI